MTTPFSAIAGTLAAAGVLGLGGVIGLRVQPTMDNAPSGLNAAQQERLDKAASASLFGQFRSSMADFLWLKVDKYLHNGVDLRGLTPLEREAKNADKVTSSDKSSDGNREHHGDETTVVPSASRDWRGPYGDIERAVQPYKNMEGHSHRDPKEALPLFRLMTISNPHFVAGYVTGASMIARDPNRAQDAITFLQEGEHNNPESLEIENALGMMYTAKLRTYDSGVPYLIRAIRLGAARDRQTLTEDEEEAYESAYRWLVLNRREAKDPAAARAAALEGQHLFPDDVVCRDYLRTTH